MSDRVYFTQEEAKTLVGIKVEALAPFPSVPKGSIGEVVKALPYEWVVPPVDEHEIFTALAEWVRTGKMPLAGRALD